MDKINFKNLPNKTTPINAENLNKIQENMEKAINEKSSLPVGGDEGQILAKASNQDNDVEWIDNIGQGGGDTLPIGAILPFSGDIIPNGWLLCDGSVIEQEDYPELFEVLAGNYGIISREKIRLPDLRGKVTVGKDSTDADFDTLGNTGGEKTHNLTIDELPLDSFQSKGDSTGGWTFVGLSSASPHNNLQPYIVTNYIIKAKMTIVTNGEVIQENDTATTENVYSASAMDNKIQALKRVTLYENASGTNTTLTLNDSVANYEDIEIFYKSNDNAYSSVKVNNANNKNIFLVNMTPNTTNNVLYVKATIVKAKNDSITVVDGLEGYGSGGITAGNKNYIVKVVGYKEV